MYYRERERERESRKEGDLIHTYYIRCPVYKK